MKRIIHALWLAVALLTSTFGNSRQQSVFQLRLIQDTAGTDTEVMSITHRTQEGTFTEKDIFHVQKTVLLDHTSVEYAIARTKLRAGYPQIEVTFTESGRKRFAKVTRDNIGKQLAIVIDGNLLSTPTIMDEIKGGKALIAGQFTEEEAQEIANRINTAIQSEPEG